MTGFVEDLEHSNIEMHTVNGHRYIVWADFIRRGMFAQNGDGDVREIKSSGYLSNERTIRKAIAAVFGEPTFRK